MEAHQYGLYTDKAKLAKEQKEKGEPLNLEFQNRVTWCRTLIPEPALAAFLDFMREQII